ncbi:MAG: phosphonoacetate hydrolase [Rhodospirillaceae bacterium]|nr:phosphonoacetate hydrolase [Rhodospirillaceae bacterium]
MNTVKTRVEVNGRGYAWPEQPLVVVCIDGSEPDYIERAVADGVMPFTEEMLERGTNLDADSVMPSFTNPNNISIATGQPPSVHGICGNFFYDPTAKAEVMMNDPNLLRAPTIFAAFEEAGAQIVVITAKDKLRRLLGHGLSYGEGGSICFSAEKADEVTLAEHGIDDTLSMTGLPVPSVYSADLSEFVLSAGVKLMERTHPDLMYLSTTDYIQHKFAPGTKGANGFYAMMDRYWQQLETLGAVLVLTADHGMSAKHDVAGEPDVIYLQDVFDSMLGEGAAQIILPITDPYIAHHGSLGSYATGYLTDGADVAGIISKLRALSGIEMVLTRSEACERFELPEDRVGDLVIIAGGSKVLGTSAARHDLTGLDVPLRSHGGLTEQVVPLICSVPLTDIPIGRRLRNFDAFHVGLNLARLPAGTGKGP